MQTHGSALAVDNLLGLYRIVQARECVRSCGKVSSLNIAIESVERSRLRELCVLNGDCVCGVAKKWAESVAVARWKRGPTRRKGSREADGRASGDEVACRKSAGREDRTDGCLHARDGEVVDDAVSVGSEIDH